MRSLFIVAVLIASRASAAADPGDSIARPSRYFFSVRSAALLCNDCSFDGNAVSLLSTVHGFNLNKFFGVGLGAGITSATSTWVAPVFGNFRLNMPGKKKNKLFIELNWGGAFIFGEEDPENGSLRTKCKSYVQPSVGYAVNYHDLRIGVMVGLQSLNMLTRYDYPSYRYGFGGLIKQGTPNSTEYGYDVTRFMVGVSLGWRD